jgi:hypothetical protein
MIPARRVRLALLSTLALAGLSACSAETTPVASTSEGPGRQQVTVDVAPDSAEVEPGSSLQFLSSVTGTADTAVLWEVVESGGGTISSAGLYLAPSTAGSYHVRASSHADPSVQATATVKVTPTPVVTVAVSPRTPTVAAGGSISFAATVGGASNTAVTWSVQEPSGCGAITVAGVYTAPGAGATCHVVARSSADPTRSDVATVTVTPPAAVAVTISPSPGSLRSCRSLTLTATVTGTSDRSVTWSVQETAGGTVSSTGVYTAPSSAGTYHVVATSRAVPTASAIATMNVTDEIVSVEVSPQEIELPPGGSAQFTATVTTSCGAYTTTQTVIAPN